MVRRFSTADRRPFIPPGRGQITKFEMLDDAGGRPLCHRRARRPLAIVGAPAGQPGEQQPVEPDRRGRVSTAEVVHHLRATVDATRMVRASGPVNSMATRDPSGALAEFADHEAHRRGDLVERQPRRGPAQLRVGRRPAASRRGCPARASSSRRAAPA